LKNTDKKYGKSQEEEDISEMIACREIVKKIIDYGVSDRQKLQIIKLLSLEIVDRNIVLDINKICKRYLQGENNDKNSNSLIDIE
jgi:hypothetical protein